MMLLDTDIFIDYLRNFESAIHFFNVLTPKDEVLFSGITEAELVAGEANNNIGKKEILLRFLSRWNKIEVNNQIAVLAGDIVREYALEIPDALIAATAIVHDAELLTKNIKDFKKVKGLKVKAPY